VRGWVQELDLLQRVPHTCPISAHHEWNFDELLDMAWVYLDLVRMYDAHPLTHTHTHTRT
jgi:ribosome-interacting GTPase 1